jgi:hypothetical protein
MMSCNVAAAATAAWQLLPTIALQQMPAAAAIPAAKAGDTVLPNSTDGSDSVSQRLKEPAAAAIIAASAAVVSDTGLPKSSGGPGGSDAQRLKDELVRELSAALSEWYELLVAKPWDALAAVGPPVQRWSAKHKMVASFVEWIRPLWQSAMWYASAAFARMHAAALLVWQLLLALAQWAEQIAALLARLPALAALFLQYVHATLPVITQWLATHAQRSQDAVIAAVQSPEMQRWLYQQAVHALQMLQAALAVAVALAVAYKVVRFVARLTVWLSKRVAKAVYTVAVTVLQPVILLVAGVRYVAVMLLSYLMSTRCWQWAAQQLHPLRTGTARWLGTTAAAECCICMSEDITAAAGCSSAAHHAVCSSCLHRYTSDQCRIVRGWHFRMRCAGCSAADGQSLEPLKWTVPMLLCNIRYGSVLWLVRFMKLATNVPLHCRKVSGVCTRGWRWLSVTCKGWWSTPREHIRSVPAAARAALLSTWTALKGAVVSCKALVGFSAAPCRSVADLDDAALQALGCKRCPQCRAVIEKNAGCLHMTCEVLVAGRRVAGCGYQWYWCCDTVYLPGGGPNAAHSVWVCPTTGERTPGH